MYMLVNVCAYICTHSWHLQTLFMNRRRCLLLQITNNNDRILPKRQISVSTSLRTYTHTHSSIHMHETCHSMRAYRIIKFVPLPAKARMFNNAKNIWKRGQWREIGSIFTFLWLLPVSFVVLSHVCMYFILCMHLFVCVNSCCDQSSVVPYLWSHIEQLIAGQLTEVFVGFCGKYADHAG